ncbi:poly-(ADP-ribose) polymerase I [Aplysia californica]|uniref:Poly [ADP-ribose] polymerase n=1 Tax=Aplysia californica TaxID=6500 RepID=C8CCN1_APLCA|nr:poly-(ADP-ribose) polymerase I [Aplysia californica]ACU83597.1 poly-(ADP-ribose) polymerase I [Aplysia californica]
MSHHDLPFQAEYAKSGRSGCKACKGNIAQGSLRLAVMVQSPHFDGKVPNWFHYACFWKRAKCHNADDIHNIHSLRWEDQEKIKAQIGKGGGGDDGGAASTEDFNTEYAKSGKSRCRGCEENIAKDSLRISKKEYESQRAKMYGPQDLWHHVDCFVDKRDELGFTEQSDPSIIKGFAKLKPEDKELLYAKLGKGKKAEKRKGDDKKDAGGKKAKKEETEEEKTLKEQSKLLWEYRDKLSKDVSNNAMKLLLELNGQSIPSGESKVLDTVADCLAFGSLDKCLECKDGQLYYTAEGYKCSGNVTEWTKCMNTTKVPKRRAFKVPKEFHDVPFLKSYKYVKRERAFPQLSVASSSGVVSSSLDSVDGLSSEKPLQDLKFVIQGKLGKSKAQVTSDISKKGGVVVTKVDKKVAAVISNKDEVKKKGKVIKEAEENEVHVISEDFLEACQKGNVAKLIAEHSIATWGSNVEKRIGQRPMKSAPKSGMTAKEEERYTKSVPAKVKMMVKGGAAVDPDSELAEKAHVVQEGNEPLTAVLGLVDIARGTNSFYKLQALEGDNKMSWWLFRAWGRVGTTIGGNKVERCGSLASVIRNFKEMYGEKTGNDWADRKNFQKIPNKFYPLEIDYGQDEEDIKKLDLASSKSSLPKNVQDLICMIFDVESMKKAMLEFEIDMKKMPLGKLSKRQIQSAYSVLTELQRFIENEGTQTQFVDATNRFYTAIPHDFGMKKPPLLDTAEVIKQKTDMLDNLLEIEVAYSLLKGGDEGEDPITSHYKKLKCKMEPLDHDSEEFQRLVTYTKNTHGSTHNMYDLEVLDVLKIAREGEKQTYRPFKDLHNRMLLWHGSRTTNFAGILSQGLRIAPPEAPVTGYMFGKGVYFADMVTKSANYCRTSKTDNIGVMLLCEVALGNMYELTHSEFVNKLPKGKHSTKGLGRMCPDPSGTYETPDGVVLPMGKGVDSPTTNTSLLYNEFIVYDTAQINMKYLFKMKFNYRW